MKKAAVINDLSGIGRCSLTVALTLLNTLQVQACPLPTAILSNQTGFDSFSFLDFTPYMGQFFQHWKAIGYRFDSIYSGFLGSKEQIKIVLEFIQLFKEDKTLVLIDPVMGDNGQLYSIYDEAYPTHMKELVAKADIITPNITEFSLLTGYDLAWGINQEKIKSYAKELAKLGPKQIVITGVCDEAHPERLMYIGLDFNKAIYFMKEVAYNGKSYSGTGDIFASVLCGYLTHGYSLEEAVDIASTFISQAITYTSDFNLSTKEGIMYEPFLKELSIK